MIQVQEIPVLIITYKRSDTTAKVLTALAEVKPKNVYVWSNAPNPKNIDKESPKVDQVRDIFNDLKWDGQVHRKFLTDHLSAKDSISGAISWFFDQEEEGIILEDDCVVNPGFFNLCSHVLEKYRNDERIGQINAHNIQDGKKWGEGDYYFSHYAQIWGWATWRRAWKNCNLNIFNEVSPTQFREMVESKFIREKDRRFWFERYKYTRKTNVDTWDAQWGLTLWMNNQICITPNENLVENIGFGNDATNTTEKVDGLFQSHDNNSFNLNYGSNHPEKVEVCYEADIVTSEKLFGVSKEAGRAFLKLRLSSVLGNKTRKMARKYLSRLLK